MAIYICDNCGDYKDDDYHPCSDHQGELVCDDCMDEIEYENLENKDL